MTNKKSREIKPTQKNKSSRKNLFLSLAGCFLFTIIIYTNSLSVPFVFDDLKNIVENPDIKYLSANRLIYQWEKWDSRRAGNMPSRPLTYFTFALNYHFNELHSLGYHLVNILLHVLNVMLLFLLTKRILFNVRSPSQELSGNQDEFFFPILVAILFAAHPINTEVVTYISHRSESLTTFFYLSSLFLFAEAISFHPRLYCFSLLGYILGLLSKEIAITLPACLLLFDYVFLSNLDIKKLISRKWYHIPFWAILCLYFFWKHFYGGIGTGRDDTSLTWSHYTYLMTQLIVILRYIKLLILPLGQCFDHYVRPTKSLFEPVTFGSLLLWCSLFLIAIFWVKRNLNETLGKIVLFASLWFFITLSPTSSFLPINDAMVERRLYLPGWAFSLLVASLYWRIFNVQTYEPITWLRHKGLITCVGLHVIILGGLTFRRNLTYQNPASLWKEAVSLYPNNPRALMNLGSYSSSDEAKRLYSKALEISPTDPLILTNMGNIIYFHDGNLALAEEYYKKAISADPSFAEAYNNLGSIHFKESQLMEAADYFKKAVLAQSRYVSAWQNLGNTYFKLGNYSDALKAYNESLALEPSFDAYHNAANVYFIIKDYDKAVGFYQKALSIKPKDPLAIENLGNAYFKLGRYNLAIAQYERALSFSPNNESLKEKIQIIKKQFN